MYTNDTSFHGSLSNNWPTSLKIVQDELIHCLAPGLSLLIIFNSYEREFCERSMERRFNDYCGLSWAACSENSIFKLCLMFESIWATDWYQIVPVLGRPTPRVPSTRMLFLVETHRFSGHLLIRSSHANFERYMVNEGGGVPSSPN
jgi:hypothetical protein